MRFSFLSSLFYVLPFAVWNWCVLSYVFTYCSLNWADGCYAKTLVI